MNKLLAIGLACAIPAGLAAEDAGDAGLTALGTVNVLVMEDSVPMTNDMPCPPAAKGEAHSACMAVHRAVLTARLQKVSALRERGRWL